MHKKFYLVIFFFLFACSGYSQTSPGSNLTEKDSVEILNQLIKLLDSSDTPSSYVFANLGVGNRLFSIKNYSLNSKQSTTNVVVYSPSIGYFHKSGFGLTAGVNLLNDGGGLSANQYSLSPSFDLAGNKNIDFGISYTHYFIKNKFSPFSSPIQNDLFTSLTYKKPWLQPGIALGYSTGEYKEVNYKDTVIAGIRRNIYDSVNYQLKAFSVTVTAGHQFLWYELLDKSDGLGFTPTLMANAGSAKTTISHKTNAFAFFNFLNKRGRIPKLQTDKFEVQSIGLNLDLNYTIGHLTIEPQLYLDYYLPATDSKRFSQVFVFNVGYTF
ncbi:MAG: hypothetical protein H7Z13_21860 [Ferruginibacter sp.]|nr:hypothetical protein [Ferruginibacter sp.]